MVKVVRSRLDMNSGPSRTWALINPGFLTWSNWEYYYPALEGMQVHSTVIPSPPFTPLAFYQVSLTNFCYPFILLGGDRHCKSKVFCTRTQHIDWNPDLLTLSPAQARLQMQTSWPCIHLTNHKTTMSPQEERVYAESFLIRNKFYNTKVKFSYLIFK